MCKDSRNFNKGAAKLEHLFEFVLVYFGTSRSHQSATTNNGSLCFHHPTKVVSKEEQRSRLDVSVVNGSGYYLAQRG